MRPRIGITCGFRISTSQGGFITPLATLDNQFVDRVFAAGGEPVLIPSLTDTDYLREFLSSLGGLLLTGGPDVRPQRYGAEPHPDTGAMHERRDTVDFTMLAAADAKDMPILAVCLGIQELNVHRGGTLHQHVPELALEPHVAHRGPAPADFVDHPIRIEPGSRLHGLLGVENHTVNSSHHQSVDRPGTGLRITARAPDGIIEAVEDPAKRFCLGVQWHPEDMNDDPLQQRLFEALVEHSR